MNLTGEKPAALTAAGPSTDPARHGSHLVTALLFPVVAALAWSEIASQAPLLITMLISVGLYFATIYLYYGLARLAFDRRSGLLWASAIVAFVLGFMASGLSNVWPLLTGCSMLLFGGVITGRFLADGRSFGRVYLLAGLAVAAFFAAGFAGMWQPLMTRMSEDLPNILSEMETLYRSFGVGEEIIQDALIQSEKMFMVITRLVPALTTLGALFQFSLGFLLFTYLTARNHPDRRIWAPFSRWRIPFGFTPLLAVAIAARLLSSGTMQLVADNIIAVMAVYYSVAGLALIEYYMNRLELSRLLKVSFYLLLFVTQFWSFLAAAALFGLLILLGFVDSFADWRSRETSPAEAT